MSGKVTTPEQVLARIATSAWGIATRAELLRAELSEAQVDHRLANGALIPEYRGVYRVGHCAPSVEARYMAAVKACGEGAVLSGRAAAYLHGLIKGKPPDPEVTVPAKRRVKDVKPRRSKLDPRDVTTWHGIPITTVPKTLVDLAGTHSLDGLARACHEAGVKYRTTPRQVEAVLARRPNAKGAKNRAVMRGEAPVTLSRLERRFRQLLREHGLPLPVTNKRAGAKRVDCRWPEHSLTVELDSYRYHNSRYAWEQDHRREREARARGDEFRRYTWTDVFEEPGPMLAELQSLTARRSG